MSHALVRTSPRGEGQRFIGYCIKCGETNLTMADALKPCTADHFVSDADALRDILDNYIPEDQP